MKKAAEIALSFAIAAIAGGFFFTASSHAQADDPRLIRAYAAGYKAQFICSAMFNGGKSLRQIERDELTDIYPHIAKIVSSLETKIEPAAKRISVKFADDMPPRIAWHNDITGCTGLPIGSSRPLRRSMGGSRLEPGALDDEKWPVGDKDARAAKSAATAKLDRIADNIIRPGQFGGKSSALLIVKNGKIAAENYMDGHNKHTGQRAWSVSKAITASYIGFVRQYTRSNFGEARENNKSADPRRNIGIDAFLRMASGLHSDSDGARSDHIYMGGGNIREWATPFALLHPPGSKFRYANNDTLIAMLKARREAPRLHPHHMFDRLGMTRSFAETDPLGDYISSSQIWTTPRDLARLGLLYLNEGSWPGKGPDNARILPADWRQYVSSAKGPQPHSQSQPQSKSQPHSQPQSNPQSNTQHGNFGYGAQFWLLNKSPDIPKDSFAAIGHRGQFLVIIPSLDLIIIRRGYDGAKRHFDIEKAIRAIILALE